MAGASIEATLELWASSLRDVKWRIRPLFTQERVAASAGLLPDGLLGNEQRKTGWMRAEAAGDPGPWRQQAIPGRGRWDADDLRRSVRIRCPPHRQRRSAPCHSPCTAAYCPSRACPQEQDAQYLPTAMLARLRK